MLVWFIASAAYAWQLWLEPASGALLHLILALVTVGSLWRLQSRAHGPWDPASLYLAVASLYVLSPLMEVAVFGNALRLDSAVMQDSADLGVTFLFAAAVGMSLLRRPEPAHPAADTLQTGRTRLGAAMLGCALLTVLYVALTIGRYGVSIGELSRGDIYADEFVLLSLLRSLLVGGLLFALALLRAEETAAGGRNLQSRYWAVAVFVPFLLLDLLILGDRRAILVTLLGAATLFAPARLSLRQVLLALTGGFALLLYGFIRNTPPSDWLGRLSSVDVLVQLSPAAQEFGGLAIIASAIPDWREIPASFPTYWQAIPQLLPSALYPERPLAPSEWFIWTYFPGLASIGASVAFNTMFEAVANAGVPGVVFVGLVTGVTIARMSGWCWHGARVGLPLATVIFTFSMRMEAASILRTAISAMVAFALFMALTEVLCWLTGGGRAADPSAMR